MSKDRNACGHQAGKVGDSAQQLAFELCKSFFIAVKEYNTNSDLSYSKFVKAHLKLTRATTTDEVDAVAIEAIAQTERQWRLSQNLLALVNRIDPDIIAPMVERLPPGIFHDNNGRPYGEVSAENVKRDIENKKRFLTNIAKDTMAHVVDARLEIRSTAETMYYDCQRRGLLKQVATRRQ